jgi:cupin domain
MGLAVSHVPPCEISVPLSVPLKLLFWWWAGQRRVATSWLTSVARQDSELGLDYRCQTLQMRNPLKLAITAAAILILGISLHELYHLTRYGHLAPFGLHSDVVVRKSDIGIPGISKLYEARLTNYGIAPVKVTACDFLSDASEHGTVGDRTVNALPGDFVHVPRGTVHCFKNTGNTHAKMLVTFTPAGMEKFFEEAFYPAGDRSVGSPSLTEELLARMLAAAPKRELEFLPPD